MGKKKGTAAPQPAKRNRMTGIMLFAASITKAQKLIEKAAEKAKSWAEVTENDAIGICKDKLEAAAVVLSELPEESAIMAFTPPSPVRGKLEEGQHVAINADNKPAYADLVEDEAELGELKVVKVTERGGVIVASKRGARFKASRSHLVKV